jgi:hypothetical protein
VNIKLSPVLLKMNHIGSVMFSVFVFALSVGDHGFGGVMFSVFALSVGDHGFGGVMFSVFALSVGGHGFEPLSGLLTCSILE